MTIILHLSQLTYAQNNQIKQKVLVFSSSGLAPLHSSPDDGFLEVITRELLKSIGYQIKIEIFPTERSIYNLNKGLVDGEMSRTGGLEKLYPNIIHVPEKIYDTSFYVYSKKTIDTNLGWESLAQKKVAYIRGWKIIDANIPETAIVTKTKNSQQLLNLINKDRVDFIVYSGWLNHTFINKIRSNEILQSKPPLAIEPMYIYLNVKHKPLIPKLAQALVEMKRNGSYAAIVKKHLKHLSIESSIL